MVQRDLVHTAQQMMNVVQSDLHTQILNPEELGNNMAQNTEDQACCAEGWCPSPTQDRRPCLQEGMSARGIAQKRHGSLMG